MRRISLITTGGTIASKRDPLTGHVGVGVDAATLSAGLAAQLDGIELTIDAFAAIGSYAIDLSMAFALAGRINAHLARPQCDGVVVTHGTDTMEETAFLADLLCAGDKPVVFTGAQRPADAPDTDGPRNMADAVRLAASPAAWGLGAVICFEQDVHAARDVMKSHTSRTDAFMSFDHGKLGEIDGTEIILHRRPALRRSYAPARLEERIELVKLTMGCDGRALRHAAADGIRAVVLEGFGRGNAPPVVTEAAGALISAGIPVVMTSRCPRGRVRPIYGNGGGMTLSEMGVIFAGDLSGPKARILLAVLLGLGMTGAALRQEIEELAG